MWWSKYFCYNSLKIRCIHTLIFQFCYKLWFVKFLKGSYIYLNSLSYMHDGKYIYFWKLKQCAIEKILNWITSRAAFPRIFIYSAWNLKFILVAFARSNWVDFHNILIGYGKWSINRWNFKKTNPVVAQLLFENAPNGINEKYDDVEKCTVKEFIN